MPVGCPVVLDMRARSQACPVVDMRARSQACLVVVDMRARSQARSAGRWPAVAVGANPAAVVMLGVVAAAVPVAANPVGSVAPVAVADVVAAVAAVLAEANPV